MCGQYIGVDASNMYNIVLLILSRRGPSYIYIFVCPSFIYFTSQAFIKKQDPVVQSVVSLMSSLRVISLTVLADSIYNILIFFAEKM